MKPIFKRVCILVFTFCLALGVDAQGLEQLEEYRWLPVETKGEVQGRHENGFVEYKGEFYLFGGRGILPVNVYNPQNNTWKTLGETPFEIHHFQPVVYGDAIYIVGGQTGEYPKELPLENIWIYYPEHDEWEKGPEIPEERRRGSGGAVLYQDKIYWVCGIEYGHTSGTNNYFDVYDLKTGEWQVLTKAPNVRDHFSAIVVDDKLYCIGGRNSSIHSENDFYKFFEMTVPFIDVYDFEADKWYTLDQQLPHPSAAGSIVNVGNYILYFGGEGAYKHAYQENQCLNVKTGEITLLSPLYCGRHGSGAILYDDEVWFGAGSYIRGGSNMSSIEKFTPNHNWESIFDGKSLAGWQVKTTAADANKKLWSIDDGSILSHSIGQQVEQYAWLINDREFDDFTLRLQFQVGRDNKGNSGVQIRSRYDDKATEDKGVVGWLDGPQVDIHPQDPWRIGLIYDETREEKRWINPSLPNWNIKEEQVAKRKVFFYYEDEGPGWNDLIIECKASRIKTILNNVLISDYDGTGILDSEAHQLHNVGMNGHIALQLHRKSENNIRFKNIEVWEQ